jgi:hypothetical protein
MKETTRNLPDVSQSNVEEQIVAIPAAGRDLTLFSAAHSISCG